MITNSIRKYRLLAGLTQSELAELCSVSKNAISDFETGRYDPRLDVAFRLADVLNTFVDELFTHWSIVPVYSSIKEDD